MWPHPDPLPLLMYHNVSLSNPPLLFETTLVAVNAGEADGYSCGVKKEKNSGGGWGGEKQELEEFGHFAAKLYP